MVTRALKLAAIVAALTLISFVSHDARADARHKGRVNPVIEWDLNAQTAIWDIAGQQPWVQARSFAMLHGAIYDAVNAISGTPYQPYLGAPQATCRESLEAAVATAATDVLVSLFPDQETRLREQYAAALAKIPRGAAKTGGIRVGQQSAAAMIAARTDDGAFGSQTWTEGTDPGEWRFTAPIFAGDGAWVAYLKPFTIPDRDMFRTAGPPALTSAQYAADLNEVKALGSVTSTTRTPDQTDSAIWWHDRHLTEWEIKRQIAATQRLDTMETARLFAMLDIVATDAAIACFSEKEAWNFWRPITAVQLADTDGNAATEADPAWMPLLVTPPFPEYTSGHSCATSAVMHTYQFFFGRDDIAFSASSVDSGTRRSFSSFSQALAEVVEARIWGGVHFRSADVQGVKIGEGVSDYLTSHFFQRRH